MSVLLSKQGKKPTASIKTIMKMNMKIHRNAPCHIPHCLSRNIEGQESTGLDQHEFKRPLKPFSDTWGHAAKMGRRAPSCLQVLPTLPVTERIQERLHEFPHCSVSSHMIYVGDERQSAAWLREQVQITSLYPTTTRKKFLLVFWSVPSYTSSLDGSTATPFWP